MRMKTDIDLAYAVEAVHWADDQTVESVRWHSFEYVDGKLRKGHSVVSGIGAVAIAAGQGHDLYLCYHGAVGRRIDLVHLADGGKTLADREEGDAAQSLRDLPVF
jgi:hypothetical protein